MFTGSSQKSERVEVKARLHANMREILGIRKLITHRGYCQFL